MRLLVPFLLLLTLASCFNLREPDAPGAASNWTPPNQPEVLIQNFNLAVNDLNLVNYERSFNAARFRFTADASVAANNQGLFSNWSFQNHEMEYVRNLKRLVQTGQSPAQLTFLDTRYNNLSADSVEFIANYSLYIYVQDTSLHQNNFTGNMILSLGRNAFNEWAIGGWRDAKSSGQPCWSELKQKYAAR